MVESGTPEACICAIFSWAGWEKLQPSMLQLATVSGQPHWQASRAPTLRIFWVVLAIWAYAGGSSARVSSISHVGQPILAAAAFPGGFSCTAETSVTREEAA